MHNYKQTNLCLQNVTYHKSSWIEYIKLCDSLYLANLPCYLLTYSVTYLLKTPMQLRDKMTSAIVELSAKYLVND